MLFVINKKLWTLVYTLVWYKQKKPNKALQDMVLLENNKLRGVKFVSCQAGHITLSLFILLEQHAPRCFISHV